MLLCGVAFAAPPDAGTLLQEQRQPVAPLPNRLPSQEEKEAPPPPVSETGAKILVKGFRFTGTQEIATEAELQELVRPSIGKELSFHDLQLLAAKVTRYLREKKGYLLAKAYLPGQDVTEGIVEIRIITGRTDGKVRLEITQPARISPTLLSGIADRAIPEGSAVRMEQMERAILLINDLPGVKATASLQPGKEPDTTSVAIDTSEGRMFRGLISGDNYGDRYTGAYRANAQLLTYDPFGRADQLTLSYTYAENLNLFQAGYTLPLGSSGLTWKTSYTDLSYQLGKDLSPLNAHGGADTIYTGVSYPVIRTRDKSVWTSFGAEYMILADYANDSKTTDRKLMNGVASVSGNFMDKFGGGGLTTATFNVTGGNADLSGLTSNKEADENGPRTQGGFARATYLVARLQRLSTNTALFASLRGQFASDNLDSSQKFILGGPTGVRAYPVGEAAADEGHALTLETRYDLPRISSWTTTQIIGFFDTGWVKLHESPWPGAVTNATGSNEYILSGAGVGANVGKPGCYMFNASWAHAIGANPGRTSSGNNADNLSGSSRFWLQLIIWL
jgi:hemolysin activation/secretion protein